MDLCVAVEPMVCRSAQARRGTGQQSAEILPCQFRAPENSSGWSAQSGRTHELPCTFHSRRGRRSGRSTGRRMCRRHRSLMSGCCSCSSGTPGKTCHPTAADTRCGTCDCRPAGTQQVLVRRCAPDSACRDQWDGYGSLPEWYLNTEGT